MCDASVFKAYLGSTFTVSPLCLMSQSICKNCSVWPTKLERDIDKDWNE